MTVATPAAVTPITPTAPTTTPPPPPTNTLPTQGTWYQVINLNSGKCLDVQNFATTLGAVLDQWTCGNGQSNQQWQFTSTGSGFYRVNSDLINMVWDVTGGGGALGTQILIQLWSFVGGFNQEWEVASVGNNEYKFKARNSGLCLDVPGASTANGVQLQQYTCNDTDAQIFILRPVTQAAGNPSGAPGPAPSGNANASPGTGSNSNGTASTATWWAISQKVVITNVGNGQCVDDRGAGTSPGTLLDQWPCNGQLNQVWVLVPDGEFYRVESYETGTFGELSWDVAGGTGAAGRGNGIDLWTFADATNQQWLPIYQGSGIYNFVARNSALCLDVPHSSTTPGVQLDQYTCNGTPAQNFWVVPFNPPSGATGSPSQNSPPFGGGSGGALPRCYGLICSANP